MPTDGVPRSLGPPTKRWLWAVGVFAFLIYEADQGTTPLEFVTARLVVGIAALWAIAWFAWRLTGVKAAQSRIAKLHGGQTVILACALAILTVGFWGLMISGIHTQADLSWVLSAVALVDAFATLAVAVPWRWFDSRKIQC